MLFLFLFSQPKLIGQFLNIALFLYIILRAKENHSLTRSHERPCKRPET